MPIYVYSPEKNFKLIFERNISFEEIIAAIENDQILDIVEHPRRLFLAGKQSKNI